MFTYSEILRIIRDATRVGCFANVGVHPEPQRARGDILEAALVACLNGVSEVPTRGRTYDGPVTLARLCQIQQEHANAWRQELARKRDSARRTRSRLEGLQGLLQQGTIKSAAPRCGSPRDGRGRDAGEEDRLGASGLLREERSEHPDDRGDLPSPFYPIPRRNRTPEGCIDLATGNPAEGHSDCREYRRGQDEVRDGQLPGGLQCVRHEDTVVRRVRRATNGPPGRVRTGDDALQHPEATDGSLPVPSARKGRKRPLDGGHDFHDEQRSQLRELVSRDHKRALGSAGEEDPEVHSSLGGGGITCLCLPPGPAWNPAFGGGAGGPATVG